MCKIEIGLTYSNEFKAMLNYFSALCLHIITFLALNIYLTKVLIL